MPVSADAVAVKLRAVQFEVFAAVQAEALCQDVALHGVCQAVLDMAFALGHFHIAGLVELVSHDGTAQYQRIRLQCSPAYLCNAGESR